MLNQKPYSIFQRSIAAFLALFLLLSDLPLTSYANEKVNCTLEEHTHSEACYTEQRTLICGTEEGQGAQLRCGKEESEGHTHNESCYSGGHVHTDTCYAQEKPLICEKEAGQGGQLTCGLVESEGHTHNESCYSGEGHVHVNECYQVKRVLVCGKEEHQHSDACSSSVVPDIATKPGSRLGDGDANSTKAEIVINNYNQNFIAYNYYCYLLSTGEPSVGGAGYTISGSSDSVDKSVIIGDHTEYGENDTRRPMTENIQVELKGLTLSDGAFFEVRPVFDENYEVTATVSEDSSLARLNLTEKAKMTLTVNADTEISNLTLAEDSQLKVIVAGGVKLKLGHVTGEGSLRLSGTGTVEVSGSIAVKNLEITGVTVSGSSGGTAVVSATDTLRLHSGTVQNLALFGYADSVSGTRTLELESGNFYNVAAIGVSEGNTGVILRIQGLNNVGLNNTNVYRDYALSYQYNGSAIEGADLPRNYRVKYVNGSASGSASTVGSRTLPSYSLPGYVFTGWLIGESTDPVTELPESGIDGDLVLSAQMQPGEVGVTFDLGFDPSDLTSDRNAEGNLPQRSTTLVASVGTVLDLTVPQRFGYVFQGWKITTGTTRQISKEAESTIISYEDLTENNGTYSLNLEAQWVLDTFPIRLQPKIGFGSEISNMQISVDGGNTWLAFEALAAQSGSQMFWDGETCSFAEEIRYQESLVEYFKRIFGESSSYPILQDTRTVEEGKTRFVSWKTTDGTVLQADAKYEYGNGGFLDSKAQDQTLSDYQAALKGSPVVLATEWSDTLQYFLTTDTPDGWSILVGDKNASPAVPDENGRITVDAALPVYYRVARTSAARISNWIFTMNQGTDSLYPELEPVASGDQYLYYKFVMPNSDVTAAYMGSSGTPVYVDIFQSPITFAENISYRGLTGITGFWYSKRMVKQEFDGMIVNAMTPLFFTTSIGDPSAYTPVTGTEAEESGWFFYERDSVNQNFYVTSRNEETKNQLKIINTVKVYLKDCNLACRNEYLQDCVGTKIGAVEMMRDSYYIAADLLTLDLSAYGNILIDLQQHNLYTVTIGIQGSNKIGVITTNKFYNTASYVGTITVEGTNATESELTLGTLFGSTNLNVQNMTLKEDAGAGFNMLVCWPGGYGLGTVNFNNLKLQAPNRWVYSPSMSITFSACNDAQIGSVFCVWGGVQSSRDFYVLEDWISTIHTLNVSWSQMVVEGSVIYGTTGNGSSGIRNSTLVVKGTVCDLHGTVIDGTSTVIANILDVGAGFNFNGRVITNMVTSKVHGSVSWDSTNQRWKLGQVTQANAAPMNMDGNGDPFLTYTSDSYGNAGAATNKHFFLGNSKTYLFGYYRTINAGYGYLYDLTIRADDDNNPISAVITEWEENNGTIDDSALVNRITNAANKSAECVSFGYTKIPTNVSYQKVVRISDNAEIYAAGNLTFFNHTTVTGGTVVCGGTFSTKRDLTVTGGSITATEIGNLYNLTMDADSTGTVKRWQKASFESCTLQTDRIGALTKVLEGTEAKGTVLFGENVNVQARTASNVTVVSDIYVNYLYDAAQFTMDGIESDQKPGTLHFTKTFTPSSESPATLAGLEQSDVQTFGSPGIVGSAETGSWRFNSPTGYSIHSVGITGYSNDDNTKDLVYNGEQLSLYAVKENYILQVKEGHENINSISNAIEGEPGTYTAKAGETVTIKLNSSEMTDQVVVWYRDAAGLFYNVEDFQTAGDQISFTMPTSNVEVFITNELKVYLDLSEISFTEDGFALEAPAENRRADSVFRYAGNFLVTETTEFTDTYNCLYFETAAAGNVRDDGTLKRTITLKGIKQISSGIEIGTNIADGAKVELRLDGQNQLTRILNPEHSEFTLVGKTGPNQDIVSFRTVNGNDYNCVCIYSTGKLGNSTLKNLTFDKNASSYLVLFSSATQSSGTVTLDGVHGPTEWLLSNYDRIALRVDHIVINASKLCLWVNNIAPFGSCNDLLIKESSLKCIIGTSSAAYPAPNLFNGISGVSSIVDSAVDFELKRGNEKYFEELSRNEGDVVLSGNSTFTVDHRLMLKKLTVKDNATVTIGRDTTGYLLCTDVILENSAVLNTDYLFVSGFNSGSYQDNNLLMSGMAAGKAIVDGSAYGGLILNGGTLNATRFAGGDVSGKVTVNGGTLNAPAIGTLGKLCGYSTIIPPVGDEEFACFYEKIPVGATVNITGGTVNVTANGSLGGINTTVNQSGGTVNLADGAVYGMTETQKTTLADSYSAAGDSIANHTATNINVTVTGGNVTASGTGKTGEISAPYGSISISEADGNDTQVSVRNCTAESGTITIRNACDGLTNPYSSGETTVSPLVGILVSGTLSARELHILHGASVYAGEAYSVVKAGENGVLEISQDVVGSSVHTALYPGGFFGMMGNGEVEYRTVNTFPTGGYQQNVYGTKRVRIHYELCDDTIDPATNSPDNPDGFLVGDFSDDGYKISLSEPTRFGFDFLGWYEQADYSGDKITQILTTNNADIVLYAKWTPRLIPFTVSVSTAKVADLVSANETWGLAGSFNGDNTIFTFSTPVEVPYRSVLIGSASTVNQVHLADYQLATYSITEMGWKNGETQKLISAGNTVVSSDMVKAYVEGSEEALTLFVNATAKRRLLLTMDLNLKGGLPKDAQFNNSATPEQSTSTTISSYADFGKTYGDAAGFASGSILIKPSAPGYTFREWNTKADGTGQTITANQTVTSSSPLRLYAIWDANPYKLVFDAGDGNIVTKGSTAPTGSDTDRYLSGTVVYDNVIKGNLQYEGADTGADFPYAWKKGYVFLGWSTVEGSNSVDLTATRKLNLTDIPNLNLNTYPALTLHAVYRKIKVTYVPNGGTWQDSSYGTGKDTVTLDAPDYGGALAGYVQNAAASGSNSVLTGTVGYYSVITTTIEGYNALHGYVQNDYRRTILRKGYTFFGWYPSQADAQAASSQDTGGAFFPSTYSNAVGTVPEYEDIALYASWKPNEYSLTLNAYKAEDDYQYTAFDQTGEVSNGSTVPLKIADEIKGTYITEGEISWPARNEWYAYNKEDTSASSDENAKRYLLGFTFDPLDPGDSKQGSAGYTTYTQYARTVTQLIQKNAIFYKAEGITSGTIFHLPEDANYGNTAIDGTTAVPDYPTDYTIPLYAVYRERSLVFIEYVVDASGTPSRTVLGSYPYNEFVDFPAQYLNSESYQERTAAGYKLLKWGVNSYDITALEYPSNATDYDANKENYKNVASSMGTFDINVYTVYAAQVTDSSLKHLTASGDPTSKVSTYTYKLPMSMQNGVIKYQLLTNDGNAAYDGFDLVSRAEMDENRYSPDYRKKIALTMQIMNANGGAVGSEVDLESSNDLILLSESSIGAGYSIRLRMYYSSVMTEDLTKTFSLKCNFFRDSTADGQDMQQFFWLKNIKTSLTPSMYTVVYDANLPVDPELNVTNWNDFDPATGKRTVETAYESALLNVSPDVEGYTSKQEWTRTKQDGTPYSDSDNQVDYGANLTLPVSEADNGRIYLKGAYEVNTYQLKLTTEVFDRWKVSIGEQEITENLWNQITGGKTTVEVDYHQTVTFTGKTAEEPAEFIRLDRNDGSSLGELDLYATPTPDAENTYTFKMPNHDVDASYQDVRTLYLEDGSITLRNNADGNGYKQGGNPFRVWRGSYEILMDSDNNTDGSSTSNQLVIDGNFNGRTVNLGNLNISAPDSIELVSGTAVTLHASGIQAKNIAVPSGASLTMDSTSDKAEITLTPDVEYAAIGGHDSANGAIELKNLKISMTLPAGSSASGIGAGNQEASLSDCGDVRLNKCEVVVDEKSSASSAYQGSWIGGTGVPKVSITNSTIDKSADSQSMLGPYILKGGTVEVLSGSRIGTSDAPVNDPIYASNSLTISDSTAYQRIESPLGGIAPIGTGDSGTIEVENSTILSEFSGSGSSDNLYSGKLKLKDAASDVRIKGIQIMDVYNGAVTIDADKAVQSSKTHTHTGSYLLISEFDGYTGQSDLTVNGLSGGTKVQVNPMTLRNLAANGDTVLQANGDLTVSGTTTIAEGKTLSIDAEGDTITLSSFGGKGSYSQTGGILTSTSDLEVGGNLTLVSVTANLDGHKLGSIGAAGVTKVTMQDSTVTAANVGALGPQNTSFTFVELNGTNTITGNLIQDHYRLTYDLNDENYGLDGLPTVLRSTKDSSGNISYEPSIPGDPPYNGTGSGYFQKWYITKSDGDSVVLSETDVSGFAQKGTLDASYISDAEDTAPEDGTKTLTLHAWMSLNGKAMIQSGANFADMSAIADRNASVINNGQWTARFEIQGTVIEGSKYQFVFTNQIPKGTKLTLCDRSGETLKWYYYIAQGAVSSVSSDAFVKMGSTGDVAVLPGGNEGDVLMEKLQLIADFSAAESPAIGNTVSMKLLIGEQSLDIIDTSLSYSVYEAATASITATGSGTAGTITVTVTPGSDARLNGKKLYAVAAITDAETNGAISVPYGASATCGTNPGTWLSGNTVAFTLGDYGPLSDNEFSWSITGLQAGSYALKWYLTAAEGDTQNPFDRILAEAAPVSLAQDASEAPWMTAVLTQVDDAAPAGQVLAAGNAHTVCFNVETNQSSVEYWVEKQTALKSFAKLNETVGSTGSGSVVRLTIPAGAGTYRVRFSIESSCDWDDVYYSFIVR